MSEKFRVAVLRYSRRTRAGFIQPWQSGARCRAGHESFDHRDGRWTHASALCAVASMHPIFTPPAGTCRSIRERYSFSSCDTSRRPIPVRWHERLLSAAIRKLPSCNKAPSASSVPVPAFLLSAPRIGALHGVSS
ncbi:hypothetical protein IG631_13790 [Alternaria alternata]|nr:hypothetical protein IG631_13790 [Alternaria alternata]